MPARCRETDWVSLRGPSCRGKVILYASGKRITVGEHRLLQTRNQVQREGPEREGSIAAARTAAFSCPGLTRKFASRVLCRALGSAPSLCCPIWLCVGSFCVLGSPWRATAHGVSEKTWGEDPQMHLSCGCRLAGAELNCPHSLKHGLRCWSSLVWPALILPIPLHTFPVLPAAHPPQGGSGRTSASEQPPPAFDSASTRPAPGRRQQLGHLQDTKRNSALSRGGAGPSPALLWVAGCCKRSLEAG